jgi:hypothetical protein
MTQEQLPQQRPSQNEAGSQRVISLFDNLIGRLDGHGVASAEGVYIQPYVYLSLHVVQMRAAGWEDATYDQVAVLSGASALFAHQPDEFQPKYAHLLVGPDQHIADATGFGYEWVPSGSVDEAWVVLEQSIDAGRPVKGWHWENVLFADYRDAPQVQDRTVFAMADGPEHFAKWWTWAEFGAWVQLVQGWSQMQLGRHTQRVPTQPASEVAARVLRDLVAWSTNPPAAVLEQFPRATFGLAGIGAYAADCESSDLSRDWIACHGINPQWAIRNATSIYLREVAGAGVFGAEVNAHLVAAATQYRAAYETWQAFYALLGHKTLLDARQMKARRLAGAAVVRAWLAHEKAALGELRAALALLCPSQP